MQGKKNAKKPKVFDESLLWNSGKMFNFQLLGLVPCICTLWWWKQFLASSKDEVICHAVLLVMELSCSEAKWLDKGPLGGWWQEWPQFLVSGLCLGIEVFLKKIKLSLACVWEMWSLVGSASGHEAALVVEASLQTCPGPFCTPKAHLLCKDP